MLDPRSGIDAAVVLDWTGQLGESYCVESSEGIGLPFVILRKDIVSTSPRNQSTHQIPNTGSGQLLRVRQQ